MGRPPARPRESLAFTSMTFGATTVTMRAQAGCTLPEIVTITGHSLASSAGVLDKYLARTSQLAESAIAKFENVLETEFAKRLQNASHAASDRDRQSLRCPRDAGIE